ncbi:MAG: glucose sorbosone dehydrogenase [Phycisphaerae bacterium]|nr:glucose sorbosone dehydrogenase [Phycisphaerae bacterium]HAW96192.1 glucose sorbosone dehydrogenase [Phycisphaerales bacterium]
MNMPSFISRLTALFGLLLVLAPISSAADRVQAEDEPAADAASKSAPIPKISFQRAWPGVKTRRPVQIVSRPDRDDVLYIVEQLGRIRTVDGSDLTSDASELALDIRDRVNARSNEEGLLSVAFHPDFAENNQVYCYYTAIKPRRAVLSRFAMDEAREKILPQTEEVILEIDQPYWNHNGGTVVFGPDGMLYLSIGDGGAANDPHGYGQDLTTLLSKVIRIDVSGSGKIPYAIPSDNPFVGVENVRPEIWAYGLRNIWRMSFDRENGDLWAGDVGQNKWEEIDLVVKGGNYGWNKREGAHPFGRQRRGSNPDADVDQNMIDPVAEYSHREGLSVTGGNVYRGSEYPQLEGVYLYADYAFGTVWGLRRDGDEFIGPVEVLRKPGSLISSFGEANDGTIYAVSFEQSEQGPGAIWKIVAR